MNLKKAVSAVFVMILGVFLLSFSSAAYEKKELKFGDDGKFTILLFTDIEETEYPMNDSVRIWNAAIEKTKPDMIVYNGDNQNIQPGTDALEKIEKTITEITKPAVENNIPFAVVFGSKDVNCGVDKDEQLKIYQSIPGCLMENEVSGASGIGAYNLTIKGSNSENDVFNLWFFDTSSPLGDLDSLFKTTAKEQVHSQDKWYENKSESLKEENGGKPMPSIVFQHEPVPEIYNLLETANDSVSDPVNGDGSYSSNQYTAADNVSGTLNVGPCYSDCMIGRFDKWKKQGDVIGAFFGHEHINDIEGNVDGIYLSQTFKSGVRGYGEASFSGARVITLDENNTDSFETESLSLKELIGRPTNPLTMFRTSYATTVKIASFAGIGAAIIALAAAAVKLILTKRKNSNAL